MAYPSPQLTSTPSSATDQYLPIKDITNSDKSSPFASPYFRQHTLRPNNITVEDDQLDDERWARQAFALGMPFGDVHRPNSEARRFAQKVQRKSRMSEKQMTELLLPLIQSSTKSSQALQVKTNTTFHEDVVPKGSTSSHSTWSMPVPVPKPNIAVGFTPKIFNEHELELQEGIISSSHGLPYDLAKVSQPTAGIFWPFFVVEVQQESLHAAQNAAAGSASTCNNAMALLAEASQPRTLLRQWRDSFWRSQSAVQSFSLSVSGKFATLNLHTCLGGQSHTAAAVRTYDLASERDMEALVARLGSIFIWAENCRFQSIFTLLQDLDKLVKLESRDFASDAFEIENLHRPNRATSSGSLSPRRRFSGFKSILADLSPKWIKV